MGITVAGLASDLCVDSGEVLVFGRRVSVGRNRCLGEQGILSNVAAGDVRDTLDHFGERTVTAIWWPEIPDCESLPST